MAVQRAQFQAFDQVDFFGAKAEPVHAGVNHYVARPAGSGLFPPRDLFRRIEHRTGTTHERGGQILRPDTMQHAEFRAVGRCPSAAASAQVDTKKSRQPASASRRVAWRAPSP